MFPFTRKLDTIAPPPRPPNQAEVIKAKLAECADQIEGAEAELHRVSLDAALSDDPQAGAQPIARLAALRGKRELLQHALAAADQAERDRQAAMTLRDHQARRRSAAQHSARLEKHALAITEAQATLTSEYAKMTEAAQSLVATLPRHMLSEKEPWNSILSARELRRFVEVESYRLGREQQGPQLYDRPGSTAIAESTTDGWSLPTLSTRVRELTGRLKAHFDASEPLAPLDQSAEQAPSVSAAEVEAGTGGASTVVPPVAGPPLVPSVEESAGFVSLRGSTKQQAEEVSANV